MGGLAKSIGSKECNQRGRGRGRGRCGVILVTPRFENGGNMESVGVRPVCAQVSVQIYTAKLRFVAPNNGQRSGRINTKGKYQAPPILALEFQ